MNLTITISGQRSVQQSMSKQHQCLTVIHKDIKIHSPITT